MNKIRLIAFALFAWSNLTMVQAATYSFMNIPMAWDAPSGTATTVAWSGACTAYPNGDDDYALVNFPAGFTFTFAGVANTQVRIMSNGMIQFGAADQGIHRDYTSVALPAPASNTTRAGCANVAPTNLLLMYWLDINTAPNIAGALVQYELLGTAPARRFVITYSNVALYGNAATRYTFQVVLRESASGVNGNFEYRYTGGASTGTGATVGVQVGAADFTQYAFNQSFIDTLNGTNILWYPQTTPVGVGAVYHFSEATWTGTLGQVIDSSGNVPALNAASVGTATTVATTKCGFGRAGSFPANTSNATIDAVATPITIGNTGSIDFWYYSNVNWNAANSEAMLFDATAVTGKPFYLMKRATGALRFVVSDNAATPVIGTTTSATQTFAANTWQHVGVSWVFLPGTNQTYIQIFLNGVLTTSARYTTSGTIAPLSTLYIGDNRTSGVTPSGGSPNSANGLIDEVKVYTAQVNAYQVVADMSCVALLDHFLIQSTGTGITCAPNTLTVVACQDVACTSNYTAGASGTFVATGTPTVVWDGTTGGATGSGFATGGTGTAVKTVSVTTAGTVTFGITTPNPTPANATTCNFGTNAANNNCVFTADTAAFVFSSTATGTTYTIPSQVSGIATPMLYLRALKVSTGNPAVCTPAIIGQTTAVSMGYTCNNPNACLAGNLATINATPIASAGTSVNLTFDANGSAPVTARYDDVGQITLNASKTVTPVVLDGVSNAYVVAPNHFVISGVTAAPIQAGNDFSATVTAYNGLATPTAAANFGKENSHLAAPANIAEGVTLSFTKCQPTGISSSTGTFSVGAFPAFASGASTVSSLNWSEVGNGDLTATLTSGNYLASGRTATGNTGTGGTTCNAAGAGNVGRFIPDHFDTVVSVLMPCPAGLICPAGGAVYSGQPFTTNVYAKNALGASTQNYDGTANTTPNFSKAVTLTAWDALGSTTTQNPPAASPGALTVNTVAAASFNKGGTVLGTPAKPVYTFATTPTNPTNIFLRATDADNVTSLRGTPSASIEGGIKVVSGRVRISNAYGSELLPLQMAATVQYFNGADWLTSSSDVVTQFNTNLSTAGGNIVAAIVSGLGGGVSVRNPTVVTVVGGIRSFVLDKPGVPGSVNISLNAPAYLLAGSNGAGVNPSSSGRATFGVYKGSNVFIYLRESY